MRTKKANSEPKPKTIRMKTYPNKFVTVSLEGEYGGLRSGDLVEHILIECGPEIVIGFSGEGKELKVWFLGDPFGTIFDSCDPEKGEEFIKHNWILHKRPKKSPVRAKEFRKLLREFRRGYD